jgi:hypothetical protein
MSQNNLFKAKYGSPKTHETMSTHENPYIRAEVARHASPEIRDRLYKDRDEVVRSATVKGAPKAHIDRAMTDPHEAVRQQVAVHGHDSHHQVLQHDRSENVRYQVAAHAQNPSILHRLAHDESNDVVRSVINNKHTPDETLRHIADTHASERIRDKADKEHYGRTELGGWIPE